MASGSALGGRPSGASASRSSAGRRGIAWSVAALVAGVVIVAVVVYHRQLWSYATHWRGGPGETWAAAPLVEAPTLRIAAVGDVGDGSADFHETAAEMYLAGRDHPFDVVFLLGDNIYPKGDPADLQARVIDPLQPLLDAGAELRAIIGNHDVVVEGYGDEQLVRLGMPGRWHAVERDGVLLVGLDSEHDDPEQLRWLEQTLATSRATWKIVALHRPPYSGGYQGSDVAIRELYTPIFRRHGVQLVLSGHDHDYQRSRPIEGTTYVVSGAGSSTRRTGTEEFTAVAFAVQHFVDIAVYRGRLLLRAIAEDGRVFDEVSIDPAGTVTEGQTVDPATDAAVG